MPERVTIAASADKTHPSIVEQMLRQLLRLVRFAPFPDSSSGAPAPH
jgi:hypothetical protein